jgi:hypothetical protein
MKTSAKSDLHGRRSVIDDDCFTKWMPVSAAVLLQQRLRFAKWRKGLLIGTPVLTLERAGENFTGRAIP